MVSKTAQTNGTSHRFNTFAFAKTADAGSAIFLCNQLAAKTLAYANAPLVYSVDAKHRLCLAGFVNGRETASYFPAQNSFLRLGGANSPPSMKDS